MDKREKVQDGRVVMEDNGVEESLTGGDDGGEWGNR